MNQLVFPSMDNHPCLDCGSLINKFALNQKYCEECAAERQIDSKQAHRERFGYIEYPEEREYSAQKELINESNYRIDNDPSNVFNGSLFRLIDIKGGVEDGWLIGALVTDLKTGKQTTAEKLISIN